MVVEQQLEFKFQTEWIREYARAWSPMEAGFTYAPEVLRRANVFIVDLRNLLRNGVVTYDEKLDGPGALWIVEGDDGDGNLIVAEIVVISEELDVTVRSVSRVVY